MGGFTGGPSTSSRANYHPTAFTLTTADQGVSVLNNRSGNTNYRVGKNAQVNITNGLSEEGLKSLSDSISTLGTKPGDAVGVRVAEQISAGGEEAKNQIAGKLSLTTWILLGAGVAVLLIAFVIRRRS